MLIYCCYSNIILGIFHRKCDLLYHYKVKFWIKIHQIVGSHLNFQTGGGDIKWWYYMLLFIRTWIGKKAILRMYSAWVSDVNTQANQVRYVIYDHFDTLFQADQNALFRFKAPEVFNVKHVPINFTVSSPIQILKQ